MSTDKGESLRLDHTCNLSVLMAIPDREGVLDEKKENDEIEGSSSNSDSKSSRDNKSLLKDIHEYLVSISKPCEFIDGNHYFSIEKYGRRIRVIIATRCETIHQCILDTYNGQLKSDLIVVDYNSNCFNKVFYENIIESKSKSTPKIMPLSTETGLEQKNNGNVITLDRPYRQLDSRFILNTVIDELVPPNVRVIIPRHLEKFQEIISEKIEPFFEYLKLEFKFVLAGSQGRKVERIFEKRERFFNILHLDNNCLDDEYALTAAKANLSESIFTCFDLNGLLCEPDLVKRQFKTIVDNSSNEEIKSITGRETINDVFGDAHYFPLDDEFWIEMNEKLETTHDFKGPFYKDSSSEKRKKLRYIRHSNNKESQMSQSLDVFISHAGEDKDDIAIPIDTACKRLGISTFLDQVDLRWGNSVSGGISSAMGRSRFVLAIISESYLKKHWPKKELASALHAEISGQGQEVLPLLVGNPDLKLEGLLVDKLSVAWEGDADIIAQLIKGRIR